MIEPIDEDNAELLNRFASGFFHFYTGEVSWLVDALM
jgi:hypothetical protein